MQHSIEHLISPSVQLKRAYNPLEKPRLTTLTGEIDGKSRLIIRVFVGLLSAVFLSMSTVQADFDVVDGTSVIERNRLRTDAALDLKLKKAPAEALRAGIPLTFLVEIELLNRKNTLWKQRIANWQYHHILNYHRLSGRYLVENLASGQMKTFATLVEALNSLSRVRSSEKLPKPINHQDRLAVRLRVILETNGLPTPLRLITLFFPDWQQSSEWEQWDLVQ